MGNRMNTRALDWKTMVGKRVLWGGPVVKEAVIDEVSESGHYIRLSTILPGSQTRYATWYDRAELIFLEVLPDPPRFIKQNEK